jgi:hypothetical protein
MSERVVDRLEGGCSNGMSTVHDSIQFPSLDHNDSIPGYKPTRTVITDCILRHEEE